MPAGAKAEGALLNAASKLDQHASHEDDSKPSSTHKGSADSPGGDAKSSASDSSSAASNTPPGGFDDTPIPTADPGFTLKFTFHHATNLPMADIATLSSDPYILATLVTGLPTRHHEDPPLTLRGPTVRRSTEPVWDTEWIVANVPASGFKLVARIMDEDPADHDDRLGKATLDVQGIDEHWPGIRHAAYKIKKRAGSKRAYLMRALAVALRKTKHMDGNLFLSVENLGRTKDQCGGRAYTIGPMWWTKHYSPMLGRLAHTTDEPDGSDHCMRKYNFQANQFQLHGPVPADLYHRFVEFKPFVKRMFKASGIQGFLLSKALHHQHNRVYNFDRTTEYGLFQGPSKDSTIKFLELVNWDEGGRIFTYVLTLDALMRFTETGKEFGIDFLSKHTMHSDVSIYIAYSGEFFVRRLKRRHRPTPEEHLHETSESEHTRVKGEAEPERRHSPRDQTEEHPPKDMSGGPPHGEAPRDPEYYELVIDNDSGTYRPNAQLLPQLKAFLQHTLPGLHIVTLDCQADAELQQRMKKEQRARKKKEGDNIIYKQASHPGDDSSSISSSDISDLDAVERDYSGVPDGPDQPQHHDARERAKAHKHSQDQLLWKSLGKDYVEKGKSRGQKYKYIVKGRDGGVHEVVRGDSLPHDTTQLQKIPVGEYPRENGMPAVASAEDLPHRDAEHPHAGTESNGGSSVERASAANASPNADAEVEASSPPPVPPKDTDSHPKTNGINAGAATAPSLIPHDSATTTATSSAPHTPPPHPPAAEYGNDAKANGIGLSSSPPGKQSPVKRKPVSPEFKSESFHSSSRYQLSTVPGTSHV